MIYQYSYNIIWCYNSHNYNVWISWYHVSHDVIIQYHTIHNSRYHRMHNITIIISWYHTWYILRDVLCIIWYMISYASSHNILLQYHMIHNSMITYYHTHNRYRILLELLLHGVIVMIPYDAWYDINNIISCKLLYSILPRL